mmetsp:Transcript_27155/g.85591  ORF Transcript_27155/g.85591 Transcript_27155/m.85591 type:complete len:375 (-) Transcript_27155:1531-2655(-)
MVHGDWTQVRHRPLELPEPAEHLRQAALVPAGAAGRAAAAAGGAAQLSAGRARPGVHGTSGEGAHGLGLRSHGLRHQRLHLRPRHRPRAVRARLGDGLEGAGEVAADLLDAKVKLRLCDRLPHSVQHRCETALRPHRLECCELLEARAPDLMQDLLQRPLPRRPQRGVGVQLVAHPAKLLHDGPQVHPQLLVLDGLEDQGELMLEVHRWLLPGDFQRDAPARERVVDLGLHRAPQLLKNRGELMPEVPYALLPGDFRPRCKAPARQHLVDVGPHAPQLLQDRGQVQLRHAPAHRGDEGRVSLHTLAPELSQEALGVIVSAALLGSCRDRQGILHCANDGREVRLEDCLARRPGQRPRNGGLNGLVLAPQLCKDR